MQLVDVPSIGCFAAAKHLRKGEKKVTLHVITRLAPAPFQKSTPAQKDRKDAFQLE